MANFLYPNLEAYGGPNPQQRASLTNGPRPSGAPAPRFASQVAGSPSTPEQVPPNYMPSLLPAQRKPEMSVPGPLSSGKSGPAQPQQPQSPENQMATQAVSSGAGSLIRQGANSVLGGASGAASAPIYGPSLIGAPGTTGALGAMSAAAPAAAAVAAPIVAHGTITGVGNIAQGEDLSLHQQAALALPTFGASFLYNPVKNLFGSGKGEKEVKRDKLKEYLQQQGFVTPEWGVNLADGSQWELRDDTQYFEPDFNNPLMSQTVGDLNPLAYILSGGDRELATAYAGWMANAAASNAGADAGMARNNVLQMYHDAGLTPEAATQILTEMKDTGKITPDEYIAYINGINKIVSDGTPEIGVNMASPTTVGTTVGTTPETNINISAPRPGLTPVGKSLSGEMPTPEVSAPRSIIPKGQDYINGPQPIRFNITGGPEIKQKALEYFLSRGNNG